MLYPEAMGLAGNSRLLITNTTFTINQSVFGFKSLTSGKAADLNKIDLGSNITINDQPVQEITLRHGVKTYKFGFNLTNVEKQWLHSEIVTFVEKIREKV